MNRLSVLQNATHADVRSTPYPHLVIRNALPLDVCEELIASYPSFATMDVDDKRNNVRWDYSKHKVVGDQRVPKLWRDFIDYHASPAFFAEILELFGAELARLYPERFGSPDQVRQIRVGVRGVDRRSQKDILLDAQISGNTPVVEASSVRPSHLDGRRALYGGLFYLRRDDDDSQGGDLTISRFKPRFDTTEAKTARFEGSYVKDQDIELVDTVKYEKNTFVLFINSIDSLHGVTVRQPTPHPRIFVNLLGDMDRPLFELPSDVEKRMNASASPLLAGLMKRLRSMANGFSS